MATYAIGDLQGCFDQFMCLLDAIKYDPSIDEIWLTGDLINRGPKNLETLNYVRAMPRVKTVLGNHDLHFLAVASNLKKQSKHDTLADLLGSDELGEIIDWVRNQPLLHSHQSLNFTMVHGGIPHIWDLEQAQKNAREVETVLQGDDYLSFLSAMYGNLPDQWSDELTGADRLRTITNYLTRMRYCDNDGKLELTHKTDLAPKGFSPWFSYPRIQSIDPKQTNHKIVFGHWAAIEGQTHQPQFIAIDTGCVWGRQLTAYCLESGEKTSVPGYRA